MTDTPVCLLNSQLVCVSLMSYSCHTFPSRICIWSHNFNIVILVPISPFKKVCVPYVQQLLALSTNAIYWGEPNYIWANLQRYFPHGSLSLHMYKKSIRIALLAIKRKNISPEKFIITSSFSLAQIMKDDDQHVVLIEKKTADEGRQSHNHHLSSKASSCIFLFVSRILENKLENIPHARLKAKGKR